MPRELTGPARRAAIVRTSMRLFAAKGFAGTTTRELARAAGISEAMVFKHFPTKNALYRAILAHKIEESERVLPLSGLAAGDRAPAVVLGHVARTLLERIETDPSFLRLLLYCALEGHPLARAFDRARGVRLRGAISEALRSWTRRGLLRAPDPDLAARAFVGLVVHFAQVRSIFRDPDARRVPRERLVREIVRFTLHGLRSRSRS